MQHLTEVTLEKEWVDGSYTYAQNYNHLLSKIPGMKTTTLKLSDSEIYDEACMYKDYPFVIAYTNNGRWSVYVRENGVDTFVGNRSGHSVITTYRAKIVYTQIGDDLLFAVDCGLTTTSVPDIPICLWKENGYSCACSFSSGWTDWIATSYGPNKPLSPQYLLPRDLSNIERGLLLPLYWSTNGQLVKEKPIPQYSIKLRQCGIRTITSSKVLSLFNINGLKYIHISNGVLYPLSDVSNEPNI